MIMSDITCSACNKNIIINNNNINNNYLKIKRQNKIFYNDEKSLLTIINNNNNNLKEKENEILFWKIWRNKWLNYNIWNNVESKYSRVKKYDEIHSVDWMLKFNIELLKDKVKTNQYLTFSKSFKIQDLIEKINQDNEFDGDGQFDFYKNLILNYKRHFIHLSESLCEESCISNNLKLFKVLINDSDFYDNNKLQTLIKTSIKNGSDLKILKYLFQLLQQHQLLYPEKELLNNLFELKENKNYNEIANYLLNQLNLDFNKSASIQFDFLTFLKFDLEISKQLLELDNNRIQVDLNSLNFTSLEKLFECTVLKLIKYIEFSILIIEKYLNINCLKILENLNQLKSNLLNDKDEDITPHSEINLCLSNFSNENQNIKKLIEIYLFKLPDLCCFRFQSQVLNQIEYSIKYNDLIYLNNLNHKIKLQKGIELCLEYGNSEALLEIISSQKISYNGVTNLNNNNNSNTMFPTSPLSSLNNNNVGPSSIPSFYLKQKTNNSTTTTLNSSKNNSNYKSNGEIKLKLFKYCMGDKDKQRIFLQTFLYHVNCVNEKDFIFKLALKNDDLEIIQFIHHLMLIYGIRIYKSKNLISSQMLKYVKSTKVLTYLCQNKKDFNFDYSSLLKRKRYDLMECFEKFSITSKNDTSIMNQDNLDYGVLKFLNNKGYRCTDKAYSIYARSSFENFKYLIENRNEKYSFQDTIEFNYNKWNLLNYIVDNRLIDIENGRFEIENGIKSLNENIVYLYYSNKHKDQIFNLLDNNLNLSPLLLKEFAKRCDLIYIDKFMNRYFNNNQCTNGLHHLIHLLETSIKNGFLQILKLLNENYNFIFHSFNQDNSNQNGKNVQQFKILDCLQRERLIELTLISMEYNYLDIMDYLIDEMGLIPNPIQILLLRPTSSINYNLKKKKNINQ